MHLSTRLLLLVPGLLLTAACGEATDPTPSVEGEDTAMGHIHGIGVDPADGSVYAATHFGLFHLAGDGPTRVADRWQDTMAFTVVGEHHFLGSGHPDLREELPSHLGLIESTDAGETWEPLALQGEADFHALEAVDDLLYAYDAITGSLMSSTDMRTFRHIARLDVLDLAVDPADPTQVLATTPSGLVTVDASSGEQTPVDGPALAYLDQPRSDLLVGLAHDGAVHVSGDGGAAWAVAGEVPGRAAALEVTEDAWYAATDRGIFRSVDDGETWETLAPADG